MELKTEYHNNPEELEHGIFRILFSMRYRPLYFPTELKFLFLVALHRQRPHPRTYCTRVIYTFVKGHDGSCKRNQLQLILQTRECYCQHARDQHSLDLSS